MHILTVSNELRARFSRTEYQGISDFREGLPRHTEAASGNTDNSGGGIHASSSLVR